MAITTTARPSSSSACLASADRGLLLRPARLWVTHFRLTATLSHGLALSRQCKGPFRHHAYCRLPMGPGMLHHSIATNARVHKIAAGPENTASEPPDDSGAVISDWRQFRARLVATDRGEQSSSQVQTHWAHNVAKPEKGCLLLAHPLMFSSSQSYFSQAVIFLFEHSQEGSAGFILNKPTELTLGKLVAAEALLPEFAQNRLHLGGDVGSDTMHLLHGCPDVQGGVEVVQGVFMGGFESARAKVRAGSKQADQFRWFNKYAGWGPGQLDQECQAGVWFAVAASSKVVLNHQNMIRSDMWHWVLELMGGDYAALSASVKAAYPDNLPQDSS